MDGLGRDRDDSIHLAYGLVPESFPLEDSGEEEMQSDISDDEEAMVAVERPPPEAEEVSPRVPILSALPPPPLPLSPVSNPSSPVRKRARTSVWEPPAHVPPFLPPFPISKDSSVPNSPEQPPPLELSPQPHQLGTKPLSRCPSIDLNILFRLSNTSTLFTI